jgi:hypothetical protein
MSRKTSQTTAPTGWLTFPAATARIEAVQDSLQCRPWRLNPNAKAVAAEMATKDIDSGRIGGRDPLHTSAAQSRRFWKLASD